MSNFDKAIEIIMAESPEPHYPAYYADLLREADVPDKDVGECSEIPNSSDLRQQAIDLLDEQIAICDRALTNPGISMNDEFAVKVEKRSLIAYREKLECLLSTSVHPEKHTEERAETHACDLIDRQAAIDALELTTWYHQNRNGEMVEGANSQEDQAWYKAEDVYKVLNDLPSAQPERKKGHWIDAYPNIEPNPMFMYGICSVCGCEQAISNKLNFCPDCGADMRGEQDE